MEFKHKLHSLRVSLGITEKEFANILGVSVSVVSSWENGKKIPTAKALMRLKNEFHCSLDYFLANDSIKVKRATHEHE